MPYGVRVPIPFPVKVEMPQYKEIEVKKNVYFKIPIYEHIPVYHHFAIKSNEETEKPKPNQPKEIDENCDELNKQLDNFLKN